MAEELLGPRGMLGTRGGSRGAGTVAGPHYVQWGPVSITVPNLIVLGLMIATFAVAVWLRLPEEGGREPHRRG